MERSLFDGQSAWLGPSVFPSILTDFEDVLSISSVKRVSDLFFFIRPTDPSPKSEGNAVDAKQKKKDGLNNILKYSVEDYVYLMNILLNHFRRTFLVE